MCESVLTLRHFISIPLSFHNKNSFTVNKTTMSDHTATSRGYGTHESRRFQLHTGADTLAYYTSRRLVTSGCTSGNGGQVNMVRLKRKQSISNYIFNKSDNLRALEK